MGLLEGELLVGIMGGFADAGVDVVAADAVVFAAGFEEGPNGPRRRVAVVTDVKLELLPLDPDETLFRALVPVFVVADPPAACAAALDPGVGRPLPPAPPSPPLLLPPFVLSAVPAVIALFEP